MEFPTVPADVLGGLGSKFLFHAKRAFLEGGAFPDCFAERFDLQTHWDR